MFAKIFIKEWRENILIFSLAILMMAAMVFLSLTGREEMTIYSSGMFLLLFLPLAALLLGSGGFYTEYKDNAWVYLFSRPIKKEMLWIFKFVSQLSILVAVFIIFYFVRRFLPGLDKIFQDLDMNYPDAFFIPVHCFAPHGVYHRFLTLPTLRQAVHYLFCFHPYRHRADVFLAKLYLFSVGTRFLC